MKRLAEKLLCLLGMPARHRRRNRRKLLVLMYHGVCAEPLVPFCWHQLPVAVFRRQLTWLRDHYQVLPLTEALKRMQAGRLPDHAAAITFDDGLRNNLTRALPVLESLELPATIFLPTAAVGSETALWPDRVYLAIARTTSTSLDASRIGCGQLPLDGVAARQASIATCWRALKARPTPEVEVFVTELEAGLGAAGDAGEFAIINWKQAAQLSASPLIDLAPHSETHAILSQCDDAELVREVSGSYKTLSDVGVRPRVFAYPNGRALDFDERAQAAVQACGMDWAVSTEQGLVDESSDALALPRMCIGSDLSFDRFRLLVTGALDALRGTHR